MKAKVVFEKPDVPNDNLTLCRVGMNLFVCFDEEIRDDNIYGFVNGGFPYTINKETKNQSIPMYTVANYCTIREFDWNQPVKHIFALTEMPIFRFTEVRKGSKDPFNPNENVNIG